MLRQGLAATLESRSACSWAGGDGGCLSQGKGALTVDGHEVVQGPGGPVLADRRDALGQEAENWLKGPAGRTPGHFSMPGDGGTAGSSPSAGKGGGEGRLGQQRARTPARVGKQKGVRLCLPSRASRSCSGQPSTIQALLPRSAVL